MLLAERCSVEAKLVHGEVVPERHVLAALGHSVRRITVKLRNVELLQVLHLLHIIGDIECTSLSFLVTVNASVQLFDAPGPDFRANGVGAFSLVRWMKHDDHLS